VGSGGCGMKEMRKLINVRMRKFIPILFVIGTESFEKNPFKS